MNCEAETMMSIEWCVARSKLFHHGYDGLVEYPSAWSWHALHELHTDSYLRIDLPNRPH